MTFRKESDAQSYVRELNSKNKAIEEKALNEANNYIEEKLAELRKKHNILIDNKNGNSKIKYTCSYELIEGEVKEVEEAYHSGYSITENSSGSFDVSKTYDDYTVYCVEETRKVINKEFVVGFFAYNNDKKSEFNKLMNEFTCERKNIEDTYSQIPKEYNDIKAGYSSKKANKFIFNTLAYVAPVLLVISLILLLALKINIYESFGNGKVAEKFIFNVDSNSKIKKGFVDPVDFGLSKMKFHLNKYITMPISIFIIFSSILYLISSLYFVIVPRIRNIDYSKGVISWVLFCAFLYKVYICGLLNYVNLMEHNALIPIIWPSIILAVAVNFICIGIPFYCYAEFMLNSKVEEDLEKRNRLKNNSSLMEKYESLEKYVKERIRISINILDKICLLTVKYDIHVN